MRSCSAVNTCSTHLSLCRWLCLNVCGFGLAGMGVRGDLVGLYTLPEDEEVVQNNFGGRVTSLNRLLSFPGLNSIWWNVVL